jgi:hypothetical protein
MTRLWSASRWETGTCREIGVASEEFAVTADEGGGARVFDFDGEGWRSNGRRTYGSFGEA